MIPRTDYSGFGYMISKGTTTIWELWNGDNANPAMNFHNHVMLVGDLLIWFYEYLTGFKTSTRNPGFKKIIFELHVVDGLKYVRASCRSVRGLIISNWEIKDKNFLLQVKIPPNTIALVSFPPGMTNIYENAMPVSAVSGIRFLKRENARLVYEIIPGEYKFKCN